VDLGAAIVADEWEFEVVYPSENALEDPAHAAQP
jgi:hypothetical protein